MSYSVSHHYRSRWQDRDGVMLPSSAARKLLLPRLEGVNMADRMSVESNKMEPLTQSLVLLYKANCWEVICIKYCCLYSIWINI